MQSEVLVPLVGVAVSMTWTPGPNNAMLSSSGATYGWHRSVPHAMGVTVGFPLMLILVAAGVGHALGAIPAILQTLKWLGLAVILVFAWRIATAETSTAARRHRPLTFLQAVGFQWVNPKAWVLAMYLTATYASGKDAGRVVLLAAAVFAVSGLLSSLGWAIFGAGVGKLLRHGWRLRAFNLAMALVLLASAIGLTMRS